MSTTIYINSKATTLKYVIVEHTIKVDYNIVKINKTDMFIYTGKYMEHWAEKIISGIINGNLMVVDVSEKIKL